MKRSDNVTGAAFMMASMASFTINDTAMKAMSGDVPLFQLLLLRGLATSVLVAIVAWRLGVFAARPVRGDWRLIMLRTTAEIAAAYFFLTALFNMELANVTAILQALPLTVTLGAAVFFHERIGWPRILAIIIGLGGVLLIIRPAADDFNSYSLYALTAVVCVTIRDLSTRRLSVATPSLLVTFITSMATMVVFGLLSLGAPWAEIGTREAGLIGFASICILGAYLFSILVMRTGDIGFTAPFRYTGLLWAIVLGYAVFGDFPDSLTLLGAAIVVASGVFTLSREARARRRTPV